MSKPFDDVWIDLLLVAEATEIKTLVQKNVNLILDRKDSKITVQSVITKNPRNLAKEDFKFVWEKLGKSKKLRLKDIDPELRGRRSIIFALLAQLEYIDYTTNPLTIILKQ